MDISVSQYNNVKNIPAPHFTGSIAEKAFSLVGGDGVFKNVTKLDLENFKAYASSMRFKMNMTADDVAALSKFDGKDFIENSYMFCTKKIGLPKQLCPPIYYGEIKNEAILGYQPMLNNIIVDQNKLNNLSATKENIFGLIRHELQHTLQYYAILRHEELGPKAVDAAGEMFAERFKSGLDALLKNNSVEEVEQYVLSLNDISTYQAIQFLKNGDTEGFDKFLISVGDQLKTHVSNLRETVLKYFRPIEKDSTLTPKLAKFFDEMHGLTYYKDDYSVSMSKYFNSSIEVDAMLAQLRADFDFSQQGCFLKYSKGQFNKMLNNGEIDKFRDRINADKAASASTSL